VSVLSLVSLLACSIALKTDRLVIAPLDCPLPVLHGLIGHALTSERHAAIRRAAARSLYVCAVAPAVASRTAAVDSSRGSVQVGASDCRSSTSESDCTQLAKPRWRVSPCWRKGAAEICEQ